MMKDKMINNSKKIKKHSKSFMEIMPDIFIAVGLYIIITLGQYADRYVKIILCVTIIISTIWILLIMCRSINNKKNVRRILLSRLNRSLQVIHKSFFVAAFISIIVLPATVKKETNDNLRNSSIGNIEVGKNDGLEVTESYGGEYSLSENFEIIKKIYDNDTFQALPIGEKKDVVRAIIYCEARYKGLCKLNVEFKELDNDVQGTYCHNTRTITININQLKSDSTATNKDVLVNALHELRHAEQRAIGAAYLRLTPEQRNLIMFTRQDVRGWIENFEDYKMGTGSDGDFYAYSHQKVEEDARKTSEAEAEILLEVIGKYLEE